MTDDYTTQNTTHDYDRYYGATVVDQNGEKVGDVGQVYLDDQTGRPSWVTVKTGLFGMKETFVPLEGDNVAAGDEIRVPYTKDFIKGAPGVDPDGHIDEAQEAELYAYYNRQGEYNTTTDRVAGTDYVGTDRDVVADRDVAADRDVVADRDRVGNADELVAREERLNVGTERVETGRVRLRKHVVTEQQQVSVPVTREEVVVERVPLDGTEDVRGGELAEGETEVVLHEEHPVVSKETVATEKVRLGTQEVTENQTVSAEVRKEQIEVDGDGVRNDLRTDVDGVRADDDRSLGEKIKDGVNDIKDDVRRDR